MCWGVFVSETAQVELKVDECKPLIDGGRVRETQYDPQSRMSSLVTAWCSRASSRQRRVWPAIKSYTRVKWS